jgi:hypothetical protein
MDTNISDETIHYFTSVLKAEVPPYTSEDICQIYKPHIRDSSNIDTALIT